MTVSGFVSRQHQSTRSHLLQWSCGWWVSCEEDRGHWQSVALHLPGLSKYLTDCLSQVDRSGVTHKLLWQVHIDGKPLGSLGTLEVEFRWPRDVSNGKWLLYLTDIQVNGTSESRCNPPNNIINPLNLRVTMATSASHSFQNKGKSCPVLSWLWCL